jgi:hypothetical protein
MVGCEFAYRHHYLDDGPRPGSCLGVLQSRARQYPVVLGSLEPRNPSAKHARARFCIPERLSSLGA